jgi:hypothetical protein
MKNFITKKNLHTLFSRDTTGIYRKFIGIFIHHRPVNLLACSREILQKKLIWSFPYEGKKIVPRLQDVVLK